MEIQWQDDLGFVQWQDIGFVQWQDLRGCPVAGLFVGPAVAAGERGPVTGSSRNKVARLVYDGVDDG